MGASTRADSNEFDRFIAEYSVSNEAYRPHRHHGDETLHFSHPLIAESPTPDTKIRFDYSFSNGKPGREESPSGDLHTFRAEFEYAFASWLSIEVDVPYSLLSADTGSDQDQFNTVEVALKYANFSLAEKNLVFGGGIELGLPTGKDEEGIGSDHILDVEPFVDFGYKIDSLEIVGFTSFGIPTNEGAENETDLELGWNLSFLYHATESIEAILEFDGTSAFDGEEDGFASANVTPGVKFQPFDDPNFEVGLGLSIPLAQDRDFDVQPILSIFYHF